MKPPWCDATEEEIAEFWAGYEEWLDAQADAWDEETDR